MKLISLSVAAVKDILEPDLHCAACAKLAHKCECEAEWHAAVAEYLDEHPEDECPYCEGVEIHEVSCELVR